MPIFVVFGMDKDCEFALYFTQNSQLLAEVLAMLAESATRLEGINTSSAFQSINI
jgi:hypothetical protein